MMYPRPPEPRPEPRLGEPCTCCEATIKPESVVWLEFDNDEGVYVKPGTVPNAHESLGVYPFGSTCARKALAESRSPKERTGSGSGQYYPADGMCP